MPPFLIVNADDFNRTEGVTRGILEAHLHGIVASTTVLVNLPGLARSAEMARAAPRLALGLHLNLTCGPPVLPTKRVASLVEGSGSFIRARGGVEESGNPSEIRGELAAQVDRFTAGFRHPPAAWTPTITCTATPGSSRSSWISRRIWVFPCGP